MKKEFFTIFLFPAFLTGLYLYYVNIGSQYKGSIEFTLDRGDKSVADLKQVSILGNPQREFAVSTSNLDEQIRQEKERQEKLFEKIIPFLLYDFELENNVKVSPEKDKEGSPVVIKCVPSGGGRSPKIEFGHRELITTIRFNQFEDIFKNYGCVISDFLNEEDISSSPITHFSGNIKIFLRPRDLSVSFLFIFFYFIIALPGFLFIITTAKKAWLLSQKPFKEWLKSD